MSTETNAKVDKYVKDNSSFNAASFQPVKDSIPAGEQAAAEQKARQDLKA